MPRSIKTGLARQRLKIPAMPLFFALLLSLALHLMFFAVPAWIAKPDRPPPATARIDARLLPSVVTEVTEPPPDAEFAESVTTQAEASSPPTPLPPPRLPPAPNKLSGQALRRAQQSLARHLFYPPQAVAQGLEGEVTLLLVLDTRGRIETAEIARSSGHPVLDQAALAAARSVGAFPGSPRQTLLPVSFSLE